MFGTLYEKVMQWSVHRHAPFYLAGLSFSESSFFPIPPDVMLAPMSLATPPKAWFFAALTTLASVLGGVLGYLIGLLAFELVEPLIIQFGYQQKFDVVQVWFSEWGFWAIFVAGFSPIPYKLFTISAGVISMAFFPFLIASAIGRGARFFLVASLMVWGGAKMEKLVRKYIDRIGWITVVLALILIWVLKG